MRHLLVGCFVLTALIVGCGKKQEEVKGTPLQSKEVDTKIKGKMVQDELPKTSTK